MYLLGSHNVIRYKGLRIWPERGLIHIEDAADNSFRTISVRDALLRVKAVNDMIGTSTDSHLTTDERRAQHDFVDDFIKIIKVAREQGTPDDPTAAAAYKRARPTQFHIKEKPAYGDVMEIEGVGKAVVIGEKAKQLPSEE